MCGKFVVKRTTLIYLLVCLCAWLVALGFSLVVEACGTLCRSIPLVMLNTLGLKLTLFSRFMDKVSL